MQQFRSKSEIVEAVQLTDSAFDAPHPNPDHVEGIIYSPRGKWAYIKTDEVPMRIEVGDWIIRFANGTLSSCTPRAFELAYEPVVPTTASYRIVGDDSKEAYTLHRVTIGASDVITGVDAEPATFTGSTSGEVMDALYDAYHNVSKHKVIDAAEVPYRPPTPATNYVQRMVEEFAELSWRLDRLVEFVQTPLFSSLGNEDRELLFIQRDAMSAYRSVLSLRLNKARLAAREATAGWRGRVREAVPVMDNGPYGRSPIPRDHKPLDVDAAPNVQP